MRLLLTTRVLPALFVLPFLGGCDSQPTPTASPAPAAAPPPAAPAVPAAAPATAFTCCADPAAQNVVGAYLDAQAALAQDDNAAASTALTTLQTQVDAAKAQPGLDAAGTAVLTTIGTEAGSALAATEIVPRREALKKLSTTVIAYARQNAGGSRSITEAYCPMAEASWLQEGSTIANPYYGAEMLMCGTFK